MAEERRPLTDEQRDEIQKLMTYTMALARVTLDTLQESVNPKEYQENRPYVAFTLIAQPLLMVEEATVERLGRPVVLSNLMFEQLDGMPLMRDMIHDAGEVIEEGDRREYPNVTPGHA